MKSDVVNELQSDLTGGSMLARTILALYPPHVLDENGEMHRTTKTYGKMSIKVTMEDELIGVSKGSLKHVDETKMDTRTTVSGRYFLTMDLKRYLSDTESYKKLVLREYLFSFVNYDFLENKIGGNNISDVDLRNRQGNKAKNTLMKILPGTQQYDMCCWKRCSNEKKVR